MTAPICPTAIIAFYGIFGQFAVAFTAQHTIHPVRQLEAVIQLGGLLKVINPASKNCSRLRDLMALAAAPTAQSARLVPEHRVGESPRF